VVPATADQGRAGAVLLRQPSAVRGLGQAGQGYPAKVEARAPDSARAEPRVPAADQVVAAAAPAGVAAEGPGPEAAAPAVLGAVAGTPATGKQA
jgi:hypothetical protein